MYLPIITTAFFPEMLGRHGISTAFAFDHHHDRLILLSMMPSLYAKSQHAARAALPRSDGRHGHTVYATLLT